MAPPLLPQSQKDVAAPIHIPLNELQSALADVVALAYLVEVIMQTSIELRVVQANHGVATAAIMMPLTGWLADRYGRKRVLVLSVVVFTVSSALCGLAQSLAQIVLFRFLLEHGSVSSWALASRADRSHGDGLRRCSIFGAKT
jgi:MFS family permease